MTTSDLRHLLGEAAHDIPAAVQLAPLASIHDRIRRRRTNNTIGALAALVLVTAGLVPLFVDKAPVEPADRVPLSWRVAELREPGRDITVLIGLSAAPCSRTDPVSASVSETADAVTITLRAASGNVGCSAVQVPLDSPLRGRSLIDGSTNEHRVYFRHSDMPALPNNGHWATIAPGQWNAPFSARPGYTWELRGEAYDGYNAFPIGEYEPLGAVSGTIVSETGPASFKYTWVMRKPDVAVWVVYQLSLNPPAGQTITSDEFRESLQRLNWSDLFRS